MAHPERVDILLVEDSPHERELTLRALKKGDQAVNVFEVEDGEEALDFIFSRGDYAHRAPEAAPRLVLLDRRLSCFRLGSFRKMYLFARTKRRETA